MPDFILTATPCLGGYNQKFADVDLHEITDLAVVSLAIPQGGETAAQEKVNKAYKTEFPEVGISILSKDGKSRLISLGQDQAFVIFNHDQPDARDRVAKALGDVVYLTDQTDVWVGLAISGKKARTALERICPVDLAAAVFPVNAVGRTSMEHLGALVIRTGEDSFLLMSASSSAQSFLHAVEISIRNVT